MLEARVEHQRDRVRELDGLARGVRAAAGPAQLARRWLASVATRLANSQNSLVGRGRVADAADRGGRVRFVRQQLGRIALSQATLAAMLDAQRPSVNKVLGEPAAAGLIEVSYPNIRVVDVARLAEVT